MTALIIDHGLNGGSCDVRVLDGHSILTVATTKEAIELLKSVKVQLILSDVRMPELETQELPAMVNSAVHRPHFPFVYLAKFLEIGSSDVFSKSFVDDLERAKMSIVKLMNLIERGRDLDQAMQPGSVGRNWLFAKKRLL